jgi:glutamate-1-semialdehyde aminotransferase
MPSDVQNPIVHIRLHIFFRVKDVSQCHDHSRHDGTELVNQTLSRIRDGRVSIQCRKQNVRQPAQITEGVHTRLPIKLARKWGGHGRYGVVSAYGSFHGRTLGALHATGQPAKWEGFQPLPKGFRHVAWNDLEALEAAVEAARGVAETEAEAAAKVLFR